MINHARTLFVNHEAAREMTPFEEYIDPLFVSVPLSSMLVKVLEIFFGPKSTRFMRNYRARQIFTLLHTCGFDSYVYALDSRITYLPFTPIPTAQPQGLLALADIPGILQDKFGERACNALYDGPAPIFDTLGQMWQSTLFTEKICSCTLAVIYQIEELRREMEGHQILAMDRSLLSNLANWRGSGE